VVDPAVVRAAQRVVAQLRNYPDGRRRHVCLTRFDEQAQARFIAWHDANADLVSGTHGPAAGWAAKYPRQVARVALVLHALHHPDAPLTPVTVELIDGAIAVIEYFRAHLPRILLQLGVREADPGSAGLVSRVAALLRAAEGRWVSRTDLHARLGRNIPAREVTLALVRLEDEGTAEQRLVQTEGRPREEWRLRTNEETKKGPEGSEKEASGHPLFVSSFLRDDDNAESGPCCICGTPLEPGRRYQCAACTEEGGHRDAERFGQGEES
jgi:hypothetical protein